MTAVKTLGLFLGSGFNQALFGMPSPEELAALFVEDKESAPWVGSFKEEIKRVGRLENLAAQYAFLSQSAATKMEKSIYQNRLKKIMITYSAFLFRRYFQHPQYYLHEAKALIKTYLQAVKEDQAISDNDVVQMFEEDVFIITTDNDLCIEVILTDLLAEAGHQARFYYPGAEWEKPGEKAIPLYKLHGSINWFAGLGEESDGQLVRKDLWMNPQTTIEEQDGRIQMTCQGRSYLPAFLICYSSQAYQEPHPVIGRICGRVQQAAALMLDQAKQLVFIGSGMPPADYKIFTFLYELDPASNEHQIKISDIKTSAYLENNLKHACDLSDNQMNLNAFLMDPGYLLQANCREKRLPFDHSLRIF